MRLYLSQNEYINDIVVNTAGEYFCDFAKSITCFYSPQNESITLSNAAGGNIFGGFAKSITHFYSSQNEFANVFYAP